MPLGPIRIQVAAGTGQGPTLLSAFDAALQQVGAADFNLVRLSSVIPPGSVVRVGTPESTDWRLGDRLPVVYAERRSATLAEGVWAGVGWVQQPDGWGLFVEHDGHSEDEVEAAVRASLGDMCARRDGSFGEVQLVLAGTVCDGRPTCAVALAMYEPEAWDR
jgi:arginine decarboxylase